jgi:hypothetical protein
MVVMGAGFEPAWLEFRCTFQAATAIINSELTCQALIEILRLQLLAFRHANQPIRDFTLAPTNSAIPSFIFKELFLIQGVSRNKPRLIACYMKLEKLPYKGPEHECTGRLP